MYAPDLITPLISLFFLVIGFAISYFIIKAAVRNGMKEHTRWQVANRTEIEQTYAKGPTPPPAPPAA